ncbi:MAG: tRNA (adenosine(37)-N6)-dimethylallyltransferase MiaA [Thermoleophilia bacterium]
MAEPAALPPVVALFGPTGMGKTEIAVALAGLLDAEIVAADSMQVYRGLPIVTNQPSSEQQARVPHHLVGVVDPRREFSAARYAELARTAVDDVLGRVRRVIVAGGSGLYLRAALGGLTFGGPPDLTSRPRLEALAASDPAALRERLRRADPATFAAIDTANPRRVVRALEALDGARRLPPAQVRDELWSTAGLRHPTRLLCLDVDRERLRERVEDRVEEMLHRGLLDEIAALPQPLSRTVAQAIGVREMLAVLAGELSLDHALERMKTRTRRYVRRQLTWMRKLNADIIPTSARSPESVAREIARRLS